MIAFKNILSSIADVGQKLFKRKIVEVKKNDLYANDKENAIRIIEGTAKSMGIEVE